MDNSPMKALIYAVMVATLLVGCAEDPEHPLVPPPPADQTWKLLATGEKFVDVLGVSSTEVLSLGSAGTLLRYDGSSWTTFPSPPSSWGAIWGTSLQDIFIADLKSIYHFDGTRWRRVHGGFSRQLSDIWGTSPSDVFAVGVTDDWRGAILHYDGSTWTEIRLETLDLRSVWGNSSNDVFTVGHAGSILHYDGSTWSRMSSGTTDDLSGVWGSSSSDVFAVGQGSLLHYDGVAWTPVNPNYDIGSLKDVCGTSSTDVYVVGESQLDPVLGLWSGLILHYDGVTWTRIPTWDLVGQASDLWAVWSSSSDVFAVGGGFNMRSEIGSVILHKDGTGWRSEATRLLHETWTVLAGVGGSSDTDVYFVGHWRDGHPSYLHFDGLEFGPNVVLFSDLIGWSDVSVVSQGAVFVVRRDGERIGRFDGAWSYWDFTYAEPASVWAISGQRAFAVAGQGRIHCFDGSVWSPMASGTARDFHDVWGASEADVFAVGEAGTICHYDGSSWQTMLPETDNCLRAVWGSSGQDVFAVGDVGTILHYDGAMWSYMANPMPKDLSGVWGSSASDVFAVGPGIMLHYDGKSWTLVSNMLGGDKIWGSSSSDVYLIDRHRIFRYGPN